MKLFDKVDPVFNIDDEMNFLIKEIDKKLNEIKINDKQKRKYMVSKSKVRSIHSSLSIEANSLPLFAVENISYDKPVLGRMDEVQEVKNAIEVYNNIDKYDYKSEKDFLDAHKIMMRYFEDDNGGYRNHGEGIKKNNEIIYMAPESILVPSLMKSLFEYIKDSNLNLLLLSSIFHYYFVTIHPFSDGNGRMARFWVSLMLKKYNKNFEFIPIEEEIYFNQEEYYNSIEKCHINSNANIFINFMLNTINISLDKIIRSNNFVMNEIQNKIYELIASNRFITQNEIVDILGISIRTVKRNFKVLIDNNIIERVGSNKKGYWEILK
ncbi:MAG: Fic family protein [Bacilli bacterium]|nr:Fic family protein [Bacilli bacterium]